MRSRFVLLGIPFLLFWTSASSDEPFIDLKELLSHRTRQYVVQSAQEICLNTPQRSGSTLVYNILRFLFDSQTLSLVPKLHRFDHFAPNTLYICTLRHPVDASLSYYRALSNGRTTSPSKGDLEWIVGQQVQAFQYLEALVARGYPCLFLRYEEFVDNFDLLFSNIEEKCGIAIDVQDKEFLKKALSKQNVLRYIEKLPSFYEWENDTHWHGFHIDRGELPQGNLLLLKGVVMDLLVEHSELFRRWGYQLQ
jgi:hypothetical protein